MLLNVRDRFLFIGKWQTVAFYCTYFDVLLDYDRYSLICEAYGGDKRSVIRLESITAIWKFIK
jgi:thiamine pyrophosphate-dependent acetolactate synthase large subunit-like protein